MAIEDYEMGGIHAAATEATVKARRLADERRYVEGVLARIKIDHSMGLVLPSLPEAHSLREFMDSVGGDYPCGYPVKIVCAGLSSETIVHSHYELAGWYDNLSVADLQQMTSQGWHAWFGDLSLFDKCGGMQSFWETYSVMHKKLSDAIAEEARRVFGTPRLPPATTVIAKPEQSPAQQAMQRAVGVMGRAKSFW